MKQQVLVCFYLIAGLTSSVKAQTLAEEPTTTVQADHPVEPTPSFEPVESVESKELLESVDWVHNLIRVQGIGQAKPTLTPHLQRLTTIRAARADAYRKLAAVVGEVRVFNEVRVGDYVKSKKIQLSGLIQGARLIGEPVYDPATARATVNLELAIYGPQSLASQIQLAELLAEQPQDSGSEIPASDQDFQAPENYTSLIIDARHLQVQADSLPTLCSPENCLVIHPDTLATGSFKQTDSLDQALAADQTAGDLPLVLKAQAQDAEGRLLFTPQQLSLMQAANQHHHFFEDQRVTLVL